MNILPDIYFEYDYVKVVYEFSLSKLRMNKKLIEKDLNTILTKLTQLKKKIAVDKKITQEVEKIFDVMIRKIDELEAKYDLLNEEEEKIYNCMEDRLKQLDLIDFESKEKKERASSSLILQNVKLFCEKKLNNLLLEFLLREKYLETAKCLIEEEKMTVKFYLRNQLNYLYIKKFKIFYLV